MTKAYQSREQDAPMPLTLLALLGVRPIYVPHLPADALLLLRYGLVLIDTDLSDEAKGRVADQTLTAAVDMLADS